MPLEIVGSIVNAGAVSIIYGTSAGLASTGNQFWHQNSTGIAGTATEGDQFGNALAAANFGKTAQADLAIGVPGETVAAAVTAPAPSTCCTAPQRGSRPPDRSIWTQNSSGILDTCGSAGPVRVWRCRPGISEDQPSRPGGRCPGRSIGDIGAAGAVNVIYGHSRPCEQRESVRHQNSSGARTRPRRVTISGRRWLPEAVARIGSYR